MRNSKERQAKQWYESLGRMFVLQSRFRLIAQQQIKEQQEAARPSNNLFRAYRMQ